MSRAGTGRTDDPGLVRARTSLAWTRTALAFAALGGVILKQDLADGLVVLGLSGLVWVVGRLAQVPGQARPGRLLVITLAVIGVSVVALMLALVGPQTAGVRLHS